MKANFRKASIYLLHIILTAIASAAIAILQAYISKHGINTGPQINPENTAAIGGGMSAILNAVKRA